VRAFGEELLADINVHDVDDIDLEIGGTDKRGNKSSAVQLAEHYPFIKSAAMALKRHHM
jgi:tyrosyl-tRNA synthetase